MANGGGHGLAGKEHRVDIRFAQGRNSVGNEGDEGSGKTSRVDVP